MTPEGRTAAFIALVEDGLSFGECVNFFAARQSDEEKAYIALAQDEWARDGEIEVDENAIVSEGDDPGAYVMAWVWVRNPNREDDE